VITRKMTAFDLALRRRWKPWSWILLGLLPVLAGCGDLFGPAHRYGAVIVAVEDEKGAAVSGVHLTLYTGARHMGYGVTDARGRYTFSYVPTGSYGVAATVPEGWTPPVNGSNVREFELGEGETREVEIVLTRDEPIGEPAAEP
jgi:hypothetical protein